MKNWFNLLLFVLLSISFIACKKEGCSDCNAQNYDVEAQKDDNSCVYKNEDKLRTYSVSDSTVDPFQNVVYQNYTIEITHLECQPNDLYISNYGDFLNMKTGAPLKVHCKIDGNTISIASQFIEGDDIVGNSFNDFTIHQTVGYFQNDSIFLNLSYLSTGGDPYYGHLWGKKN